MGARFPTVNEDLKAILRDLLDEVEDLRALQVVTTVSLQALPSFAQTDMEKLKNTALDKNRANYEVLRQAIAEL
jgi:hypothetical protein